MEVKLITVVIPCFNEEFSIEEFYRRITALKVAMQPNQFEFIFVNDCSSDATGSILNNLADQNSEVRVLHLAQNMGHQIALTAGLDYAIGDVVVTIDADLQDPPELVIEMLKRIEEGYDIVHTQRKLRKGETRFKLLSAWIFYRLMSWFSSTPIIENCGDYRAFTRQVRDTIATFRMPHRFLRGIFVQLGFRQCVIAYDRDARFAGETKYNLFKMIRLSIDAILSFSAAPVRIISMISILLWVISLWYLVKALIHHLIYNLTVPGWTSIIVLLFFFTGLILFSIAIIGSYVGRIFQQGQNRPLYWLSSARNVELNKINNLFDDVQEIKLSRAIIKEGRQ